MAAIFSRLFSRLVSGVGAAGAFAVLFVPPIQDALTAFLTTHPKLAPFIAFLALVLAGFGPSASKAIGQAVVAKDVETAASPRKEQAAIVRQTQDAVVKAEEIKAEAPKP